MHPTACLYRKGKCPLKQTLNNYRIYINIDIDLCNIGIIYTERIYKNGKGNRINIILCANLRSTQRRASTHIYTDE